MEKERGGTVEVDGEGRRSINTMVRFTNLNIGPIQTCSMEYFPILLKDEI